MSLITHRRLILLECVEIWLTVMSMEKIVTFHDARFCNSNVWDTHFRKQMLITPDVVLTHYCLKVWCKTKMTYILLFTYTDAKTL